jgi:hypothetical protein
MVDDASTPLIPDAIWNQIAELGEIKGQYREGCRVWIAKAIEEYRSVASLVDTNDFRKAITTVSSSHAKTRRLITRLLSKPHGHELSKTMLRDVIDASVCLEGELRKSIDDLNEAEQEMGGRHPMHELLFSLLESRAIALRQNPPTSRGNMFLVGKWEEYLLFCAKYACGNEFEQKLYGRQLKSVLIDLSDIKKSDQEWWDSNYGKKPVEG